MESHFAVHPGTLVLPHVIPFDGSAQAPHFLHPIIRVSLDREVGAISLEIGYSHIGLAARTSRSASRSIESVGGCFDYQLGPTEPASANAIDNHGIAEQRFENTELSVQFFYQGTHCAPKSHLLDALPLFYSDS